MKRRLPSRDPTLGETTHVKFRGGGHRLSLAGPALGVVAIIAVIGMIIVSVKLIQLSERAVMPTRPPITSPYK